MTDIYEYPVFLVFSSSCPELMKWVFCARYREYHDGWEILRNSMRQGKAGHGTRAVRGCCVNRGCAGPWNVTPSRMGLAKSPAGGILTLCVISFSNMLWNVGLRSGMTRCSILGVWGEGRAGWFLKVPPRLMSQRIMMLWCFRCKNLLTQNSKRDVN